MNDGGDCRTAPATPGLLIICLGSRLCLKQVEEVSKKKIPITYNIFFYDTSSASVIKEEDHVEKEDTPVNSHSLTFTHR